MTFLEKPKNTPPRFKIHMLSDPRPFDGGEAYLRRIRRYIIPRSAFSAYETNTTWHIPRNAGISATRLYFDKPNHRYQ